MKTPKHIMNVALHLKKVCEENELYEYEEHVICIIGRLKRKMGFWKTVKVMQDMEELAINLQYKVEDFNANIIFKQVIIEKGLKKVY